MQHGSLKGEGGDAFLATADQHHQNTPPPHLSWLELLLVVRFRSVFPTIPGSVHKSAFRSARDYFAQPTNADGQIHPKANRRASLRLEYNRPASYYSLGGGGWGDMGQAPPSALRLRPAAFPMRRSSPPSASVEVLQEIRLPSQTE